MALKSYKKVSRTGDFSFIRLFFILQYFSAEKTRIRNNFGGRGYIPLKARLSA